MATTTAVDTKTFICRYFEELDGKDETCLSLIFLCTLFGDNNLWRWNYAWNYAI